MTRPVEPIKGTEGIAEGSRQSVQEQIRLNQARTPTERFNALCDLLDSVRAMSPRDPQACERRRRLLAERERNRERLREFFRRIIDAGGADLG